MDNQKSTQLDMNDLRGSAPFQIPPPPLTSSSTALQEITEDVTQIVKDSLASLAEKDANLFLLYEEKMKLSSLVEDLESEKEKLTTQLHGAIDALQRLERGAKELQENFLEHQKLLRAIHGESQKLSACCGISFSTSSSFNDSSVQKNNSELLSLNSTVLSADDLQTILQTLKHCANLVRPIFQEELPSLQKKLHWTSRICHKSWQAAYEGLMQAELRERQLIVEEGISSLSMEFAVRSQIKLAGYCDDLEKEIRAAIVLHEQEKHTMNEQHRSELSYRMRDLNRKRETIKKLESESATKEETITLVNSIYAQHTQRALLWIQYLESKVQLLQQRCNSAESLWRKGTFQCVMDFQNLTQAPLKNRISELLGQNSALSALNKKQALTVTKQEKLADSYSQKMTASTEKIKQLSKELDDFKEKHNQSQHQEQQKRQKLEAIIQEQKNTVFSLEERVAMQEEQYSRLLLQETVLQKEKEALQKRVETLTSMVETLQPAAARGETLSLVIQRSDEQIASLTEQLAATREGFRQELMEAKERIRVLEEEKVKDAVLIQEANRQLQRAREKHAQEAEIASAELKKVRRMMNTLCEKEEGYIRQLEMERCARKVFENQQQLETTVMKKLMDRVDKAEREESGMSAVQSERDTLRRKVLLLEETCQQNAAVIAELRECVFAERQLSSQLLSSMSSPVKHATPHLSTVNSSPSP